MTLLDDICQVHDGVLKAPPLRKYGHAYTVRNSRELAKSKSASADEHDHAEIYINAKALAIDAIRIMKLASENIEKESSEKCKLDWVEYFNRRVETKTHPIAVLRIEHDKPVFAYVSRDSKDKYDECASCHKFNTCKIFPKLKYCMEHDSTRKTPNQKDDKDYVFEIGLLLGTVRL